MGIISWSPLTLRWFVWLYFGYSLAIEFSICAHIEFTFVLCLSVTCLGLQVHFLRFFGGKPWQSVRFCLGTNWYGNFNRSMTKLKSVTFTQKKKKRKEKKKHNIWNFKLQLFPSFQNVGYIFIRIQKRERHIFKPFKISTPSMGQTSMRLLCFSQTFQKTHYRGHSTSRTQQRDKAGGTIFGKLESHSHMIGDDMGHPPMYKLQTSLKCMALWTNVPWTCVPYKPFGATAT